LLQPRPYSGCQSQPRPTRTRADAFGLRQRLRTTRAVPVPPDVVGPGDDRLAARIPPRVNRPVIAGVVVAVEPCGDLKARPLRCADPVAAMPGMRPDDPCPPCNLPRARPQR